MRLHVAATLLSWFLRPVRIVIGLDDSFSVYQDVPRCCFSGTFGAFGSL